MKNGIRSNLFILFTLIMVGFVACGILLNASILEEYYVFKNMSIFKKIADEVRSELSSKKTIQTIIEDIDRREGISITIADMNNNIINSSFPQKKDSKAIPKEIEQLIESSELTSTKYTAYDVIDKQSNLQPRLAFVTLSTDNKYIILTKPMKGIRESVSIANEFYIFAGVITLLFGSIFMFRFSDTVTKPVIQMSKIAENISELKFGEKAKVSSNNELAILANSLNILSDKLKTSIDGLKDDIEYQKTLSRNISHEFKTPIGIIKGYAEGLLFGIADSPEMKEKYLKTITSECDRMDSLVIEMLMLSKLSAKDFTLTDVVSFPANSFLDALKERFDPVISAENVNLTIDCPPNVSIRGNYDLMNRAIGNLLSNAIKYSDENKYVNIRVEKDANTQITVFNSSQGIPSDELPKIFEEFYKSDKSRNRGNKGHGLGLPIVLSIVKLHNGTIAATNVKGGIEFKIILPN